MIAHQLAEQLLAMAVAVGPGSVEEVAAERNRSLERCRCLVVVRAGPAREAPHPIADLAHRPAQPPKTSILHLDQSSSQDQALAKSVGETHPTRTSRFASRRTQFSRSEYGSTDNGRHRPVVRLRRKPGLVTVDQFSDQGGPSRLVAGAESGAAVAVEVLIKRDQVAPVGIGLK